VNSPVVDWEHDVSVFSMHKDFVFGKKLDCRLEIVNCVFSVESYSEIVEAIARDVYSVEGDVKVSETEYEVFTTFKFDGVEHEQTHILEELSPNSVAHLTVFSKVDESHMESLRRYIKSLVARTEVSKATQNLDLLSFSLV
jgi:hypothetical protein